MKRIYLRSKNKYTFLRICSRAENAFNRVKRFDNKSGFKGVARKNQSWQAKIQNLYLGLYPSKKEAALAYNKAAIKIFGEFAHLNPE
jgi:hypothetical protein